MPDPVTQFQILAADPDAVASFYSKLFGWRIDTKNSLGYRAIDSGGLPGGIWPAPPGVPAFVQLFIDVADVDATIEQATAAGAKVLVPRSALPDGDVMAVLLDPNGLSFGVVQRHA